MSPTTPDVLYNVLETLTTNNIPLENFIRRLLLEPGIGDSPYMNKFKEDLPQFLGWLAHHEQTRDILGNWVKQHHTATLMSQIRNLSRAENGFHFNASAITAEKMKKGSLGLLLRLDMFPLRYPGFLKWLRSRQQQPQQISRLPKV
ncbi:hypothetical protein AGABI1DRAFT_126217 [Agaricus bisporus var. burnettii JB137-S8]|uniref:Uncharacterized protein n=1 Tax=Agaricus bisporus var. burnettii (strain JB137-S8 / ATCC MYA-4627 / FGSC 10392) TaxID=597362 RepID=K5Y1Z7_AGABU|nr:uncharacterized protein AGABI1DRAFT_126217 [Agaricus bisporus var. burnettii JB137-S8]EKM81860.1 hypothetical protein AGABI1DRAFT_126217 [Agaricus bisporus var. burnettii JB137-S8]